jgi:hypothetical protein
MRYHFDSEIFMGSCRQDGMGPTDKQIALLRTRVEDALSDLGGIQQLRCNPANCVPVEKAEMDEAQGDLEDSIRDIATALGGAHLLKSVAKRARQKPATRGKKIGRRPFRKKRPNRKDPVCQDCGTREKLVFAADPYQSDVNNDETEVWKCESCRHESAMAI